MTIASEITRLQGVKSNILRAIADKGVDVPAVAALADCPELIASISGGGGSGHIDGFDIKMVNAVSGIYICDVDGYIGLKVNDWFSQNGSPYPGNYAIVARGVDYSQSGLGRVTFLEFGSDTIGGRTYPTVTIGGVTWMAENLDFKADGIVIGATGTSSSEARANYYNNDEATYGENGNKYGLLYNWVAAKALTIAGWHLPTSAEWDALATAVGGNGVAGTKLKSNTGWTSGNGTNDYGFSAFPAGYYNGSFGNVGSSAYFWTATEYNSSSAYYRYFNTSASMNSDSNYKGSQYSVRLVKDSASA